MTVRAASVGVKLSVVASLFGLMLIVGLAGTLINREEMRLEAQIEQAAHSYALAAREAMVPRLDAFGLHYATHDTLRTPGVAEAAVVGEDGKILSDSVAKRIGGTDPIGRRTFRALERRPLGDGFEIIAPIGGQRHLGVARVRMTRASAAKALAEARRNVFTLAGLAGLFNVLGVVLLIGREREKMRTRLGKYVNSEVAETVVDGEIRLEGRTCDVTVVFTDLRGFTRLSEHLPPIEIVRLLNDYFQEMVGIIDRHGGWVDKFMGDGLLAVFGEKRGQPDHAVRGAACALELRECIARFNVERLQRGLAALKLGVALNSGQVVAGTVGSRDRLDFTVIGDTVNVAARLEGLNTKLGTDLLVTEATHDRARDGFVYEDLGELTVRGHEAPVRAYRLVGRASSRLDTPRARVRA